MRRTSPDNTVLSVSGMLKVAKSRNRARFRSKLEKALKTRFRGHFKT